MPPSASASAILRLRRSRSARSLRSRGFSSIASRPKRRQMEKTLDDQSGERHKNIKQQHTEQTLGGGLTHFVLLAQKHQNNQQQPKTQKHKQNQKQQTAQPD